MARIKEDIRFYLPADPYYYQVDNLPLKDLLNNDIALQDQIDSLSTEQTNVVTRDGIRELQPFIDLALPGKVAVRPGNFIGRTNRTTDSFLGRIGGAQVQQSDNGTREIGKPPTESGDYNVANPPNLNGQSTDDPAKSVARTAVFNFQGGSIAIDAFNFDDFATMFGSNQFLTEAPLGRIDLIGITTVNGAIDDPFLPGNVEPNSNIATGDGQPRLAVVKGAGIIQNSDTHKRQLTISTDDIGRRFFTIGTAAQGLNQYGRDLGGNVVPNPEFGTIPMPDDVVNVLYSKDDVEESLFDFVTKNINSSFFLPLAYVFVPQNFVAGSPIPENYLKDIRPLFRTAELTLQERQAAAFSQNPSLSNPFVTKTGLDIFQQQIDNIRNDFDALQQTVNNSKIRRFLLRNDNVSVFRITKDSPSTDLKKQIPSNAWLSDFNSVVFSPRKVLLYVVIDQKKNDTLNTRLYASTDNVNFKEIARGTQRGGEGNRTSTSTSLVMADLNESYEFWLKVDRANDVTVTVYVAGCEEERSLPQTSLYP